MNLTIDELHNLRTYTAEYSTKKSKALERKITEEIGDASEYYEAVPELAKIVERLEDGDIWRLIKVAETIIKEDELPQ